MKFMALPAILFVIVLAFLLAAAAYSNSEEGKAAAEKSRQEYESQQRNKAEQAYRSQKHIRDACLERGDIKGAGYAQKEMDKLAAKLEKK